MKTLNCKPTLEVLEDRLVPAVYNPYVSIDVARAPVTPSTQLISSYSLKLQEVFVNSVRAAGETEVRSAAYGVWLTVGAVGNNFEPGDRFSWGVTNSGAHALDMGDDADWFRNIAKSSKLTDFNGDGNLDTSRMRALTASPAGGNYSFFCMGDGSARFGAQPPSILIGMLLP